MRGQSGICILCRYGLIPRASSNATNRLASSRSREPYVLPRMVIDLDAADSKFVKRYEDMTKEEVEKSLLNPRREFGVQPRQLKERTSPQFTRHQPFYPNSITPPDLLAYALLGDPLEHSGSNQLKKVFREAGIRPGDSQDTKIQYLVTDFSMNAAEHLTKAGFSKKLEYQMKQRIETCKWFPNLQRIVSVLSTSPEGCNFLAANGKAVLEGIRRCRRFQTTEDKVSASMVLRLLNNLQRSMESKGIEIGEDLCNTGIYYAAKDAVLPAVKMYLEISWRNSYPINHQIGRAIRDLQRIYLQWPIKSQFNTLSRVTKKEEILTLITGWERGGAPRQGEERKLSFASLLHGRDRGPDITDDTQALYPKYIGALGEMGLSDTLWAEWIEDDVPIPSSIRKDDFEIFRARLFALAFLIARDKKSALSVLKSVSTPDLEVREKSDSMSDGPSLPLRQDLLMISAMNDHYWFQPLRPTVELWSKVKKEFRYLPEDPEELLEVMEQYIVPDYREAFAGNLELRRDLDWAELGGQEGLLVASSRGTAPLYFKPAQRSAEPTV